MVYHVTGKQIENASEYELLEKIGEDYVLVSTSPQPDFDLGGIDFPPGDHTLVVRARAYGYRDSGYSNEVIWSVA